MAVQGAGTAVSFLKLLFFCGPASVFSLSVAQGDDSDATQPHPQPVVLEPQEKKEAAMMHRLHTMYKDKEQKRKAKVGEQRAAQAKKRAKEDAEKEAASAKVRKKRYVRMGMEEKRQAKRAKTGGGGGDD